MYDPKPPTPPATPYVLTPGQIANGYTERCPRCGLLGATHRDGCPPVRI